MNAASIRLSSSSDFKKMSSSKFLIILKNYCDISKNHVMCKYYKRKWQKNPKNFFSSLLSRIFRKIRNAANRLRERCLKMRKRKWWSCTMIDVDWSQAVKKRDNSVPMTGKISEVANFSRKFVFFNFIMLYRGLVKEDHISKFPFFSKYHILVWIILRKYRILKKRSYCWYSVTEFNLKLYEVIFS